jgi:signal transduction histidine kinase
MDDIDDERMQKLALRSMVAHRCRRAYLHEIRGGIQPIASSFELLHRAANAAPFNQALAAKASEFFRRAVDGHERVVQETLGDICGEVAPRAPVDLEDFTGQALRFLQNDAATRQVSLQPAASEPVVVQACGPDLRLLVLALLTHAIDHAAPGDSIRAGVQRLPRAAVVMAAPRWAADSGAFRLIRTVGSRLMAVDGGTFDAPDGPAERVTLSW